MRLPPFSQPNQIILHQIEFEQGRAKVTFAVHVLEDQVLVCAVSQSFDAEDQSIDSVVESAYQELVGDLSDLGQTPFSIAELCP